MLEEGVGELHRHALTVIWVLVLRDAEQDGRSIGGCSERKGKASQAFTSILACGTRPSRLPLALASTCALIV